MEQVAASSPKPEDGDLAVAAAQGMDLYKRPWLKALDKLEALVFTESRKAMGGV